MRALYPRFVRDELACKVRYPHRLVTDAGLVRFRRSRWEHMNQGDDEPAIRRRESAFWLYAGRERIALLELYEYDLETGLYWDEFWTWADGLREQDGLIVEAMREAFGEEFAYVADYGSIVIAAGAWIAPAWRARLDMRAAFDTTMEGYWEELRPFLDRDLNDPRKK